MPTLASLTVKKNDGTTDIIYDALAASAGDGVPAYWRQDTGAPVGKPVGLRPTLKISTKNNGPKTARVMEANYVYPYATVDSTTTLYSAKDRVILEVRAIVPQAIPASEINEAVAQGLNLVATALVKSVCQSGFAPT